MKIKTKILLFIFLSIILLIFSCTIYYFIIASKYNVDLNKLTSNTTITFYDDKENELEIKSSKNYVDYSQLPKSLINAFISIEDKRFYTHKGIDYKGILRAFLKNIKSFSLKEGASTITQQLVKNTYLTNEKTINRKIIEISLAKKIERIFTKEKIIEMYLNTIYFGDNCYGISKASYHYFDKSVDELTINEIATLASIIKSPYYYSPTKNYENAIRRKNLVLLEMFNQGYITKNELIKNKKEKIQLSQNKNEKTSNFESLIFSDLDKIIEEKNIKNKNIKVYTTLNKDFQQEVEKHLFSYSVSDSQSAIIISKNGEIKAYSSNIGEVNRQIGSTIKPLLVYAPAIENDIITQATIIEDKETTIDGYTPKNYNDKYLGKITVKDAIANSSNVCAVKTLNLLGIEKAKSVINKLPLNLNEKDNNLNIALGTTNEGTTLKNLTGCYTVFLNNGNYIEPFIIEKIIDSSDKIIYKSQRKTQKIFGEDTTFILNDCLNNTVKNGTAKKLKNISENLCAKTGTVGNENGNMDAYSICYNQNYISSVWLGNEKGNLMKNNVTGGNQPTAINREIIKNTYLIEPCNFFEMPESVTKQNIDKISLYDDSNIEIAESIAPNRYIVSSFFKKNKLTKNLSTRFSSPKIEISSYSVINSSFCLSLCVAEYYNFEIIEEIDNIKNVVYDSKNNERKTTFQFELKNDKECSFYVVPYFNNVKGEELIIAKIKPPKINSGDWWLN